LIFESLVVSKLNITVYKSQIMTTKRELIETKAIELLKSTPQGIRTSQLINALKENLPDVHPKTINGTVWKLPATRPKEVYKPSRGVFRHVSFRETY
jgi:hypothetical protein